MPLVLPPFHWGKTLIKAKGGRRKECKIQNLRIQPGPYPHSNWELNPYPPVVAAEMSGETDGGAEVGKTRGSGVRTGTARVVKKQDHPPDDLVALVAHGSLAIAATAPSWAPSSGRLHDGGAVLQRRGCGGLAVPGHHCARLVWGIALGKCRVHGPGWAAGGAGGGRACQGQGKWLQGGTQGPKRTGGRAQGSLEEPATPMPLRLPTPPQAQAHYLTRPGFLGCS